MAENKSLAAYIHIFLGILLAVLKLECAGIQKQEMKNLNNFLEALLDDTKRQCYYQLLKFNLLIFMLHTHPLAARLTSHLDT